MRSAVLAVISIALAAGPAAADHFGPAADIAVAMSGTTGDLGTDGQPYLRVAAGVQRGRVALLLHLDATALTPPDPSLDSSGLTAYGKGAGLRVELIQRHDLFVHLTTGVSWWHLTGDEDVRRGCSTFGGCDAGFYREVPEYTDVTPWVALGAGLRPPWRTWPGVGLELGLAPMKIDRSGVAPDAHGVVVWLGLNVALGSN